jgi:hypothetical protein
MPSTDFNSTAKISEEAREAVAAAFDAMSTWREEMLKNNEKSAARVIDKVAEAAQALGWPKQIVDATRMQMQTANKMQLQTIDSMIDAWKQQIKSPTQSSALLSKLNSLPNFGLAAGANGDMNPFGIYMQFAEQWRKAWADGLALWTQTGKGMST